MQSFDPSVEMLPREPLRALQFEKFRSLLSVLFGRNRFYTQKWHAAGISLADIHSLDDLRHFPPTTKDELVQAQEEDPPFGTNATFPETSYTRIHQTSGTTGAPLRVLDTAESWNWWGMCWRHVLAAAGLVATDRVFLPFSFGPFIGFWAAVRGTEQLGAMMIPGGGWDSLQRLRMMRDLGATVVCSTPTYALRLAEVARENNFDLGSIPVRALIHAGEPGANIPRTKARIESLWSAKCFDHAGASEVGAYSFECLLQPGGIHVLESEFIAEILSPETGREVSNGEVGELVVTNLGRPGYPVVRYRTGDLARLSLAPCDCGRTLARLEGGLLGRVDDMVTIRGVNIYPTAIENIIRQFATVEEFQVTAATGPEAQRLDVQIEVVPGSNDENVRSAVEQALYHALSLRPSVSLARKGSLARYELKARRFRRIDGPLG